MIRSVKEKDKLFMKVMKNDVSLKSVLNNDLDVAVQLMSEFAVPLLEKMIPNIKKIDGVPRSEEIGDGDDEADAVFEKIRTMLKEKRSICVGTDEVEGDAGGIGGEHLKSGVVGTHAYTVLDATVTKSGAKLIKLRNPWASYTVGYKKNSKGALEAEAVKTDNNGIFWIELNHFVSHVNQIFGSAQP